jgi:hypothetical protein
LIVVFSTTTPSTNEIRREFATSYCCETWCHSRAPAPRPPMISVGPPEPNW